MRVENGIPRYRNAEEFLSSGRAEAFRGRDVAVRSAAGTSVGGLKILVDETVVAFVDVPSGGDESEAIASVWAYLVVQANGG